MSENYNWDLRECKNGYLPKSQKAWKKIFAEWQKRDWDPWLREKLRFPFSVKRTDDEDDAFFTDVADFEPFRLGHEMKAIAIEMEDDFRGFILKVREGRKVGCVPLCDVEVTSKDDVNYWPVREYALWFTNREGN